VIAVVSHADLIKLACAYYIGMHMDLFQRLEIGTCSVTAFRFTKAGRRLLAMNDQGSLAHLRPKPPDASAA
jgi:probable phosphoglycerate mutase